MASTLEAMAWTSNVPTPWVRETGNRLVYPLVFRVSLWPRMGDQFIWGRLDGEDSHNEERTHMKQETNLLYVICSTPSTMGLS